MRGPLPDLCAAPEHAGLWTLIQMIGAYLPGQAWEPGCDYTPNQRVYVLTAEHASECQKRYPTKQVIVASWLRDYINAFTAATGHAPFPPREKSA